MKVTYEPIGRPNVQHGRGVKGTSGRGLAKLGAALAAGQKAAAGIKAGRTQRKGNH